ncbi:hypothetical protein KPATCC21470_2608 [Kitasatospora purpeofusca]
MPAQQLAARPADRQKIGGRLGWTMRPTVLHHIGPCGLHDTRRPSKTPQNSLRRDRPTPSEHQHLETPRSVANCRPTGSWLNSCGSVAAGVAAG